VEKFVVLNRASFEYGHPLKSISSQTRKSNRRLQFPVVFLARFTSQTHRTGSLYTACAPRLLSWLIRERVE